MVHWLIHRCRIGGYTYTDVLHIYGLSRAGYIPQLFSLRLPNPEVIFELLVKANARALIYDATFAPVLEKCHVPIFEAKKATQIDASNDPVPTLPVVTEHDIAFLFHTSGSTSGSPKLVPCSYRWLDTTVTKSGQISAPRDAARQDVTSWMWVISPNDLVLTEVLMCYQFLGEVCVTLDKHSCSWVVCSMVLVLFNQPPYPSPRKSLLT